MTAEQIQKNVETVRKTIAAALNGADRAVLLVAATKMNDAAAVRASAWATNLSSAV